MLIYAMLAMTPEAFGFEPLLPAYVHVESSGDTNVIWEAVPLGRVEVVSTLLRWSAADPHAPTEVVIDAATLLDVSRGDSGFDAETFALGAGPTARIAAYVNGSPSATLFAEHLTVTATYSGQPNRLPVTAPHLRFFRVVTSGIVELSQTEWDELVDPVELMELGDGTIEEVRQGYVAELSGSDPVVGSDLPVPHPGDGGPDNDGPE